MKRNVWLCCVKDLKDEKYTWEKLSYLISRFPEFISFVLHTIDSSIFLPCLRFVLDHTPFFPPYLILQRRDN